MDWAAIINLANAPAPAPEALFAPTDLEILTVYLPMKQLDRPIPEMRNLSPSPAAINPFFDPEFFYYYLGLDDHEEGYCFGMDEESTTPSTGEWVPINVTEITRNGDELPVGVMESFEYFEDMIETGWRLDVYTNQRFLPFKMLKVYRDQAYQSSNSGGSEDSSDDANDPGSVDVFGGENSVDSGGGAAAVPSGFVAANGSPAHPSVAANGGSDVADGFVDRTPKRRRLSEA